MAVKIAERPDGPMQVPRGETPLDRMRAYREELRAGLPEPER